MIVQAVIWGLIGLGIGFLVFALGPPMFAMMGGYEAKDAIMNWYVSLAQSAIGDAALFAREQGGLTLASISYDPKFHADKASVDGEEGHIADDFEHKSRLKNKPFGIALESHPVYISPLIAEFADAMAAAKDDDRLGLQTDGGMRLDLEIPTESPLPTLRDAHRFLAGDCKRRYSKLAESWTVKSQEGFHDRITLGETMLLIAAAVAGSAMAWFIVSYAPDGSGRSTTTIPITLALGILGMPVTVSKKRRRQARFGIAALASVAVFGVGVGAIWLFYSPLIAIGFSVVAVTTAVLPWAGIRLMGKATPFGGLWARGLWILAQLSVGSGALVRADTGHYEYHPLQEDDGGFYVELDNGDVVDIEGDDGDLYRFAWRPLAVTEQKTDRNLGPYTVDETEEALRKKETRETRQDYDVHHPKQYHRNSWLLSAARLKNLARGSAGSKLVRNGRNKALEEEGGTKQLDPMWTMILTGGIFVVMFIMTYFALGGV